MDINKLINGRVEHEVLGEGVIDSVTLNDKGDDYCISVTYYSNGEPYSKDYVASTVIRSNTRLRFMTDDLQRAMKELLGEIEQLQSQSCEESERDSNAAYSNSIHEYHAVSSNSKTDELIAALSNGESIALELVSLFGDDKYENELYEEAFPYFEKSMNGAVLDKQRTLCVIVALAYIALKYYDGDLHSKIEKQYRRICAMTESNYNISNIKNAFYKIVGPFRKDVKYFDPKSFIAVPIILGCAPNYRVNDLFRISYDIYKRKLLCDEDITDDQIKDKVNNALLSLKNRDLIQNDEAIKGTNYLMSKFTQSCIYSGVELDSLVSIISRCIRLIICHITLADDAYYVEKYYEDGFKTWQESFDDDEKRKVTERSKSSRPFYRYRGGKIYVYTGEVVIDDTISPDNLAIVVYSRDRALYKMPITDPNAVEFVKENDNDALAGYKINRCKFEIDGNPLDDISYTIVSGDRVIKPSNSSLFRRVLFFDGQGEEVKPGTDYCGELFMFSRSSNDDEFGESIKHLIRESYYLSTITVDNQHVYTIDEEPYIFYRIKKPQLTGYCVPWAEFESMEHKRYPIYLSVSILFEASCQSDSVYIELDGKAYYQDEYSDVDYDVKLFSRHNDGSFAYVLKFRRLPVGYHTIKLMNAYSKKTIKDSRCSFIFEPNLKKEFFSSTTSSVLFDVVGGDMFEDDTITMNYGDPFYCINAFVKELGHGKVYIYPTNISYSIDGNMWTDISEGFDYWDIDKSITELMICGPRNLKAAFEETETRMIFQSNLYQDDVGINIYKLPLGYFSGKIGDYKKVVFTSDSYSRYMMVNLVPRIYGKHIRYNHDSQCYTFSVDYRGENAIGLKIHDMFDQRKILDTNIRSEEQVNIPLDLLTPKTRELEFSLYCRGKGGLFSGYSKAAFWNMTYNVESHRPPITVDEDKISITLDRETHLLNSSFEFDGDKCLLVIKPYGTNLDMPIKKENISSSQIVSLDTRIYPFSSFDFYLYDIGEKNGNRVLVFSRRVALKSFYLNRTFKIKCFITKKNNRFATRHQLFFSKIEWYEGRYWCVCRLFDPSSKNSELNDVYVHLDRLEHLGVAASIFIRHKSGRLRTLQFKSGYLITGIVIDIEET